MSKTDFSYFYAWEKFSDETSELVMAEFAENGITRLAITGDLLERIVSEPGFYIRRTSAMKRLGLSWGEPHGLWGTIKDLNTPDPLYRDEMMKKHILAMKYCAGSGCGTYTVHIGAWCCYNRPYSPEKVRENVIRSLETLLPEAEKLGLVIAVENSFEPTNTVDEVIGFMKRFDTPALGVCFDAGHANIMRGAGKDPSSYCGSIKAAWENKIVNEDRPLEKLYPYIVNCHLHDNDGYSDAHGLPGHGTVNWKELMPSLRKCPRLVSMQSEVNVMPRRISVAELAKTFGNL